MEIGSIILHAYNGTAPDHYLVCDGSAVSRDEYSDLFEVIGTTYGSGDGSTTFNLPNLSGRVPVGPNLTLSVGDTGGESTHTLQTSEIATHSHTVPSHTHANDIVAKTPKLSHTVTQPMYRYNVLNGGLNAYNLSSGFNAYTSTTSAGMSRTKNLSVAAHDASTCTMSGEVTDCPAFDTDSAGSNDAHNNMMPYLSLVYLIQYEPEIKAERMLIFNNLLPVAPSGAYLKGRKG